MQSNFIPPRFYCFQEYSHLRKQSVIFHRPLINKSRGRRSCDISCKINIKEKLSSLVISFITPLFSSFFFLVLSVFLFSFRRQPHSVMYLHFHFLCYSSQIHRISLFLFHVLLLLFFLGLHFLHFISHSLLF